MVCGGRGLNKLLQATIHATTITTTPHQEQELKSSQLRVEEVVRGAEEREVLRSESINKLSKSLHESQLQCNRLLDSGEWWWDGAEEEEEEEEEKEEEVGNNDSDN